MNLTLLTFWCLYSSVSQLKDMNDEDDVLLEFFMCLPQLKQVTSDKEELVNNIVEMASEFLEGSVGFFTDKLTPVTHFM